MVPTLGPGLVKATRIGSHCFGCPLPRANEWVQSQCPAGGSSACAETGLSRAISCPIFQASPLPFPPLPQDSIWGSSSSPSGRSSSILACPLHLYFAWIFLPWVPFMYI